MPFRPKGPVCMTKGGRREERSRNDRVNRETRNAHAVHYRMGNYGTIQNVFSQCFGLFLATLCWYWKGFLEGAFRETSFQASLSPFLCHIARERRERGERERRERENCDEKSWYVAAVELLLLLLAACSLKVSAHLQ